VSDLIVTNLVVERSGHAILDECSGEFASGRRTVLWGRSGAGKSTLLSTIAGLISPRSGTIQLGSHLFFSKAAGIDVPPHERNVGFVFQDLALWPHLSAVDHVYLVGRPAGLNHAGARSLLESVGLARSRRSLPGPTLRWRTATSRDRARSSGKTVDTTPRRTFFIRRSADQRFALPVTPPAITPGPGTDNLRHTPCR